MSLEWMCVVSQDAKVTALQWPAAPAIPVHVMPIGLLSSLHLTTSVTTAAIVTQSIALAVFLPPKCIPLHNPLQQEQRFYNQVINSLVRLTKLSGWCKISAFIVSNITKAFVKQYIGAQRLIYQFGWLATLYFRVEDVSGIYKSC